MNRVSTPIPWTLPVLSATKAKHVVNQQWTFKLRFRMFYFQFQIVNFAAYNKLIMLTRLKNSSGVSAFTEDHCGKKKLASVKIFVVFPSVYMCSAFLICRIFAGLSKVTRWSWYGASTTTSTQCPWCCQVYNEPQRLQVQWKHDWQHSWDAQQDCYTWTLHSRAGESLPCWHLDDVCRPQLSMSYVSTGWKSFKALSMRCWNGFWRKRLSCSLGMTEKPGCIQEPPWHIFLVFIYACFVKSNELLCCRPQNFLQKNRCIDLRRQKPSGRCCQKQLPLLHQIPKVIMIPDNRQRNVYLLLWACVCVWMCWHCDSHVRWQDAFIWNTFVCYLIKFLMNRFLYTGTHF